MRTIVLRRWFVVHKWTSLACTLFLLVICLTGLPLVFHEEIHDWQDPDPPYAVLPDSAPRADLDRLTAEARRLYPGQIVTSVAIDDDEPQVFVALAPSWAALEADPDAGRFVRFDARTGAVLERSKPPAEQHQTFLGLMFRLHVDLFAGLGGELFLGAMALLFVAAIVSGVVLYGPFMKRLPFGSVRTRRTARLRWLDLHNLIGIVLAVWTVVVGLTGAMNELSTPLFAMWQRTDVAAMVAPWKGKPPPAPGELSSVQGAFDTAQKALPGMIVTSIIFPGGRFGSLHHYLLFTKGRTPLTARLFSPVLIDARTGALTAAVRMPWYLRTLEISRPLHFGDYGGMPLKILWALFDLVTIVVLLTELVLWFRKRSKPHLSSGAQSRAVGADPDDMLEPVVSPHAAREAAR